LSDFEGYPCPGCGEAARVVATRLHTPVSGGVARRWRRRECPECGQRFTTYEVVTERDEGGRGAGGEVLAGGPSVDGSSVAVRFEGGEVPASRGSIGGGRSPGRSGT
jgi:hypothetical protein